jgi:hypothetical protein
MRRRRPSHRRAGRQPVEFLEPRQLFSHTYYVSPTGNDTAAGTSPSAAWQTLAAVNATTLQAGDTVLLQGGATFAGTLTIGAADAGTTAAPITISSFGTGRATISAGSSDGIDVTDTSGLVISNLDVEGNSPTNDTSIGINLDNDQTTGGRLSNGILINDVDVAGFGLQGIAIDAATLTNGFANVTVSNSTLHNDDEAGLYSYAGAYKTNPAPYGMAHANIVVNNVDAYDNAGNSIHGASGDGIELGDVEGATIENCTAYGNGTANPGTHGGPVGIWTYNSDSVVIEHNESYDNTSGDLDGDGFDLDGGTTNATVEYNYSHDNAGSGILLCQFANGTTWGNNTVRYNVSQNDGGAHNYAAIDMWAASNSDSLGACDIYGNTIYDTKTGSNAPRGIEIDVATTNIHVRDNIIDVAAGGLTVQVKNAGTGLLFQGNDYWAGSSSTAAVYWNGTTYATLAAWRAAVPAQETVSGTATGLSVNPQLSNPGGGGTIGYGGDLTTLSAYRIATGSPLVNAGVNLTSLGLSVGATDYFGQPVPDGSGFDIGADEVDVIAPTATATLPAVVSGAASYTFTVRYADNVAVVAGSITTGDVIVTGPLAYSQTATLTSTSSTTNGTPITATYSVPAPGGSWGVTDAGTYTVSMVAGQVTDPTGNAVAAGSLGTFTVAGGALAISTAVAYLRLSTDGTTVQLWNTATPGSSSPTTSMLLSALSGLNVPAGTSITFDTTNGSLPATVPVTFAAGSGTTTVSRVGSTASTLAATVSGGATVAFAGTQAMSSLNVAAAGRATVTSSAGNAVLLVGTLTLATVATLDLTDNDLAVTNGSLSTLTAAAKTGYASGAWTGTGLTSSTAAADSTRQTAVGVASNSILGYTTLDGVAVPAGAVLAKWTYYGDANLDGVVNAADYTRVDAGFVEKLTGWVNGDFNYDGVVDGSDYSLIDNAYNMQDAVLAAPAAAVAAVAATPATAVATPAAAIAAPETHADAPTVAPAAHPTAAPTALTATPAWQTATDRRKHSKPW